MTRAQVDRIHNALHRLDNKANVAGYIVMKGDQHVATIRFSYPRDGAGRLAGFVADWAAERPRRPDDPTRADFETWTPWQYGWADGFGYDKATAALSGMTVAGVRIQDDGHHWDDQLRHAGFTVLQAV